MQEEYTAPWAPLVGEAARTRAGRAAREASPERLAGRPKCAPGRWASSSAYQSSHAARTGARPPPRPFSRFLPATVEKGAAYPVDWRVPSSAVPVCCGGRVGCLPWPPVPATRAQPPGRSAASFHNSAAKPPLAFCPPNVLPITGSRPRPGDGASEQLRVTSRVVISWGGCPVDGPVGRAGG